MFEMNLNQLIVGMLKWIMESLKSICFDDVSSLNYVLLYKVLSDLNINLQMLFFLFFLKI